jgi:bacillithiol biosynthesis deacetylase BshB1
MTSSPLPSSPLDVLFIGAHPDDIELYAGATAVLLQREGLAVGFLDLTRGECSTRGTPEQRKKEAAASANVLKIAGRWNLGLPDAKVQNTPEHRLSLVSKLRQLQPRIVVTHWPGDRHPDHNAAHELVKDCIHLSYVSGFKADFPRHKIEKSYWFPGYNIGMEPTPSFVVDITQTFDQKMKALQCYKTQFAVSDFEGESTTISSPQFLKWIEGRARCYGNMIGVDYGEPFISIPPLAPANPVIFFK